MLLWEVDMGMPYPCSSAALARRLVVFSTDLEAAVAADTDLRAQVSCSHVKRRLTWALPRKK